jgi:hypothetical protein
MLGVELPVIALSSCPHVFSLCRLVVASPLVCHPLFAPPSRRLIARAGVASPLTTPPSCPLVAPPSRLFLILLLHHPLVILLRRLVLRRLSLPCRLVLSLRRPLVLLLSSRCATLSSSYRAGWCCVASCHAAVLSSSPHPLILSSSSCCTTLLSSHRAGWLLRCYSWYRHSVLLLRGPLILPSSSSCCTTFLLSHCAGWCCIASCRAAILSSHCVALLSFCRPLVAPPSHHLIVPAGCCVAAC